MFLFFVTWVTLKKTINQFKHKPMAFDIDMIKEVYSKFEARVTAARELTGKPLTLSEKILYTHLWDGKATTAYYQR